MLNTKMQGYPVRHGLAALKPSSPMLSPLALAPSLPPFQFPPSPFLPLFLPHEFPPPYLASPHATIHRLL